MGKRGDEFKVLHASRICWFLAGLDAFLGGVAMLAPRFVMKLFSPGSKGEEVPLIRRTAALWLFFIPFQVWGALRTRNPLALRAVSLLRFQEVIADPVWLAAGKSELGRFGWLALGIAPSINFTAGFYLWMLARKLEKKPLMGSSG